jgi:KipI family sensor histidine kinase inhibitor
MRIFPLGDSAATVEFGNELSLELNGRSICLAKSLSNKPFPGMIEAAPAYASVTVFYDRSTRFDSVQRELEQRVLATSVSENAKPNLIEIPIVVSDEFAPDLDRVANFAGLSSDETLDTFLSGTYRVYMLGFLPGFAYMGQVDDKIAAPRLETPRTKVPKGSIGIAGKQTGIYPLESPGGWNIIGRTDLQMFDPASDHPCPLKPGDEVRFVRC